MLHGLDLFSGIGGLTQALAPWIKPIAYCENDRYAQSVLLSRMFDGTLPCAPIWDDVKTLCASHIVTDEIGIDIIYGGFPCQDISVAGAGKGLEGKRSGLFKEIVRLAGECRPSFIFLENVPAIRIRGLGTVIRSFTDLGYDCRWTCVSAAEVGANHLRKRWFMLAYADSEHLWDQQQRKKIRRIDLQEQRQTQFGIDGPQEYVADACRSNVARHGEESKRKKIEGLRH